MEIIKVKNKRKKHCRSVGPTWCTYTAKEKVFIVSMSEEEYFKISKLLEKEAREAVQAILDK